MKKLKIVLMTFVIIGAISTAFATKPNDFCDINEQFYKIGFSYLPAGELGVNYACIQVPFICTYWQPNPVMQPGLFVPCKNGLFFSLL